MVLVNPEAGGGRAARSLSRIERSPSLEGRAIQRAPVRSVADVCRALDRGGAESIPVAAGGDGTISMLALALDEAGRADRTIGLLPLGTMNILAREVGIRDLGSALRALSSGQARPVDLMRTSHPSLPIALTSLSAGFEGVFVGRYQSWRRFGRPAGAVMGMVMPRTPWRTVELTVDGQVIAGPADHAFSAGVYNAKHYPLGVVMSRDADISDGVGESAVYLTEGAFWRTVASGFRGGAREPGRHVRRTPWATAVLETDGPIQADGEALDGARIEIKMEPAGLHVLSLPTND